MFLRHALHEGTTLQIHSCSVLCMEQLLNQTVVHSVEQKSICLIFRTSLSGSDVRYSCHHNSSRVCVCVYVYIHDELLRVSASYLAVFKDIKYKG